MKKVLLAVILCFLVFTISCNKKQSTEKKVQSGKVYIINRNGEESPYDGGNIEDKVRIRTEQNGKIEIPIDPSRKLFLNENTTVTFDLEKTDDGSIGDINVTLLKGELLLINLSETKAFSLTTDAASVIGEFCKFNANYYPQKNVLVVKSHEGTIKVFPSEAPQIELEKCSKILIKSNGEISNTISITNKDIDDLNIWVPESEKIEGQCLKVEKEEVVNKKPVWKGSLKLKAKEKESFLDTAKAVDPEGKQVTYYLEKGPRGLSIDKMSGIIKYKNPVSGTYRIKIVAQDEDGESNSKVYYLTVPGKLQAVIDVKENVILGESVKIDASESRNSYGENKGLLYRFDINGDGKWDGDFTNKNSIETEFKKAGNIKLKVEIKDENGKTNIAETTVKVIEKLEAKISHSPKIGKVGSEFKVKVESKNISELRVRWDLNNDGKWDIPVSGDFGNKFLVSNIWDKKGKYPLKVELKTKLQNLTLYDTIIVYDGVVIDSIQAPDTISVNEKVKIKCFARDEKNKIVEYAWDFAGVGLFDKKEKINTTETTYKKSGIYTIVCAVTNDKGMSISDVKEIIVLNADATVAAGGPYSTTVNRDVLVRGMGRDPDSKIVEYLWDLDFDGSFEVKSNTATQTKANFKRAGDHKIIFGIVTDDGKKMYDTSFVKVSNRAPHAEGGEDQVSRPGKKIKLNGLGKDPDNNLSKYEWDFNEDGKYEFSSKDSGYAEFKFEKFTKAVFKVTDQEGFSATDTVRIVICPKGMITNEEGKFCIDKYEYPNTRKKTPTTSLNQKQAEKECAKKGKRLCKLEELELACTNGNDRFNYPYGKRYEEYNCNTVDSKKTQNRIAWSGQYSLCATKDGVFDMTGNVAEWAAETDGQYGYAVGGWWQDGRESASCGKYVKIKKNKGYGHVGFRCCK